MSNEANAEITDLTMAQAPMADKTESMQVSTEEPEPGVIEEMQIAYQDPTGVFWSNSTAN